MANQVQLYNRHFGRHENYAPESVNTLAQIIATSCKHCGYPPGAHVKTKCLTEPTTYEMTGCHVVSGT